MEAPLREIVTNCGEEPSAVLNKAPKKDEPMGAGHGGGMGGMAFKATLQC